MVVGELCRAQRALDRLHRGRSSESQRLAARARVLTLTDELEVHLALLGVATEDAAPGAPLEPVGAVPSP